MQIKVTRRAFVKVSGEKRTWLSCVLCGCDAAVVLQKYKDTLQTQVLQSAGRSQLRVGVDLPEEALGHFQEQQVGQLYQLMLESTKPNTQFNIQE